MDGLVSQIAVRCSPPRNVKVRFDGKQRWSVFWVRIYWRAQKPRLTDSKVKKKWDGHFSMKYVT